MTNSESWQTSGKQEHAQGEAEYKAAQAEGYVEGTKDRALGYKDSVVGALVGDSAQQTSGMSFPLLYIVVRLLHDEL